MRRDVYLVAWYRPAARMSLLVHLTAASNIPRILRAGIRTTRATALHPAGVYAMPVTRNFYVSHQWLRELKSSGARVISAVYFRIPDSEPVLLGHDSRPHLRCVASEAAGAVSRAPQPEGFELLVPRRIEASGIHRVKSVPQVLGWRYFPGANGSPPCGCPGCLPKGTIKGKRIRDRYDPRDSGALLRDRRAVRPGSPRPEDAREAR